MLTHFFPLGVISCLVLDARIWSLKYQRFREDLFLISCSYLLLSWSLCAFTSGVRIFQIPACAPVAADSLPILRWSIQGVGGCSAPFPKARSVWLPVSVRSRWGIRLSCFPRRRWSVVCMYAVPYKFLLSSCFTLKVWKHCHACSKDGVSRV